ncbi:MAG: TetR/AcrR family transcriptional regulator [Oceanicaulis sp.]
MAAPINALKKQPVQARSRGLVEAVIDAAARILVEAGQAGLTTNHVAERAGVSIGSLYQYFPDKTAILAALFARHHAEIVQIFESAPVCGDDLEADLRAIIDAAVAAHQVDPALHEALTACAPTLAPYVDFPAIRADLSHRFAAFFEQYAAEIAPRAPADAAFIAEHVIESVVHGAVLYAPQRLGPALAEDLAKMLAGHLAAG